MAKGKKTGGRTAGTANRKTREVADRCAATGVTPLEVLLEHMRELYDASKLEQDTEKRRALKREACEVAKDAAPYMHSRLQPVNASGSTDQVINVIIEQKGRKHAQRPSEENVAEVKIEKIEKARE